MVFQGNFNLVFRRSCTFSLRKLHKEQKKKKQKKKEGATLSELSKAAKDLVANSQFCQLAD